MIGRLRARRAARLEKLARWGAECAQTDLENFRRLDHEDGRL